VLNGRNTLHGNILRDTAGRMNDPLTPTTSSNT
jgi:hypothetical protein